MEIRETFYPAPTPSGSPSGSEFTATLNAGAGGIGTLNLSDVPSQSADGIAALLVTNLGSHSAHLQWWESSVGKNRSFHSDFVLGPNQIHVMRVKPGADQILLSGNGLAATVGLIPGRIARMVDMGPASAPAVAA